MTNALTHQHTGSPPLLRPYQREAGRAIVESVRGRRGDSITVEIARQGGKNELSAQVELTLLVLSAARRARGGEVRADAAAAAPHQHAAALALHRRVAAGRGGADAGVGDRAGALAASTSSRRSAGANVVGHTASLLLEADEAQDIAIEKFDREFRPMASSTNATTVYYGTAWDDASLLERAKQANLEAERRDGRRRHFEYDWEHVARWNPAYGAFVERERRAARRDAPALPHAVLPEDDRRRRAAVQRGTARAARRCARARTHAGGGRGVRGGPGPRRRR